MKLTFIIISSSVYLEIKRKQCLPAITTETSLQKYNINSSREGKGIKQNIRITLKVDIIIEHIVCVTLWPLLTLFHPFICLSKPAEMSRPPPRRDGLV